MNADDFRKWIAAEEILCVNGNWEGITFADSEIYAAEYRDRDACRAEVLSLNARVNPLFRAKALLYRGKIQQSQAILSQEIRNTVDPAVRAEVLLENARLQAHLGNWRECVTSASDGLSIPEVSNVTRLSLHQVRGLARFELNEQILALQDIREAESLQTIYSSAQSCFYTHTLRVRVLARTRGVDDARRYLDRLWRESIQENTLSIDRLVVLIRGEYDLMRLLNQDVHDYCWASYLAARAEGDRLYSSLALLDCYFSSADELKDRYLSLLQDQEEFERVKKLKAEVESTTEPGPEGFRSSTAITIRNWIAGTAVKPSPGREPDVSNTLVIPSLSLAIRLSPWKMMHRPESKQLFKAVSALANGPQPKAQFFTSVWGGQKYTPRLHDSVIWSLVSRLRKDLELTVELSENQLTLKDTFVLQGGE